MKFLNAFKKWLKAIFAGSKEEAAVVYNGWTIKEYAGDISAEELSVLTGAIVSPVSHPGPLLVAVSPLHTHKIYCLGRNEAAFNRVRLLIDKRSGQYLKVNPGPPYRLKNTAVFVNLAPVAWPGETDSERQMNPYYDGDGVDIKLDGEIGEFDYLGSGKLASLIAAKYRKDNGISIKTGETNE